jgi:hypothetical protein
MLVKKLNELHNSHVGKKIIVCGCGMSLLELKDCHPDFITIGVNDVPALFDPTYLVITDHPVRFSKSRQDLVNGSNVKAMLTCVKGWRHEKMVMFELGKKGVGNLNDPNKVDHFLNSPYAAINIAYKMGARTIGMIGVDFSEGHFYSPKDGKHSLARMGYMRDINAGYRMIRRELEHNGAKLYNLSQISTVEPVEKISIEEFKNL